MRNIFSRIMLVAAAAMAFVSCQKQEIDAQETFSATLTVNADVQTKTYLEDNAILWGTGESVNLYLNDGEANFIRSASTDQYDGQASAAFTFELNNIKAAESYVIGGIYPVSAVVSDNNDASKYKVILPAIQNAEAGKYDPSAFIMVLKPETLYELPKSHTASFRRAVALNKITLTGVKEDITSVEITVPAGKYLTGRRYFDLTAGTSGDIYNEKKSTLIVNSSYTGSSIDVWFTSWGVELAEGENLTVKMTSATGTYTRSIAARAEGIKFLEGDLNTLTINMTNAEKEEFENLSGLYLVVSSPETWALMSTNTSGKYYDAIKTSVTKNLADVACSDFYAEKDVEKCVWEVEKMEGGYSLMNTSTEKYVSYSGNDNEAHMSDEPVALALTVQDDGTIQVESVAVPGRKLQYLSSSSRFSFYTSSQKQLYFIPWIADETERIFVDANTYEVEADATSLEFGYSVRNITDVPEVSVKLGATMAGVSARIENEKVILTFAGNADAEEKTAIVVLSYGDATPVEVVVTQAAAVAPSSDVWALVTDASTLAVGDQIVIVASGSTFALSTQQKTNNRGQAAVVKSNSEVTFGADVQILTLRAGTKTNTWALDAGTGYLYAASSSDNNMKTQKKLNDNGSWVITITADGVAELQAQGTNTINIMRYNEVSGLFSCYASGQKDISIYKLQN